MVTNERGIGESHTVSRQKWVGWRVDGRPQSLGAHFKNCSTTLRNKESHWEILGRRITWSDLGLKDPCLLHQ